MICGYTVSVEWASRCLRIRCVSGLEPRHQERELREGQRKATSCDAPFQLLSSQVTPERHITAGSIHKEIDTCKRHQYAPQRLTNVIGIIWSLSQLGGQGLQKDCDCDKSNHLDAFQAHTFTNNAVTR
jgi:hypothetical protein